MARKSPAFSFYPDSWVLGTMAMGFEEQGVYLRMLCFQWSNGPSDANAYANACGLAYVSHVERILSSKFVSINGLHYNERLEEERKKQVERSGKAKDSAKRRWNGEKPKKPDAAAMRTHQQNGCERINKSDANALPKRMLSVSDSVSDSITDTGLDSDSNEREREVECDFAEDLEIPEPLRDDPEFVKTWQGWLRWHFATTGTRLNSLTGQEHLRACFGWGAKKATENIRHTIANRTTPGGIWEKREQNQQKNSKTEPRRIFSK